MDIRRAVESNSYQMTEPCQIINIEDLTGYKEAKLEKWLEEQIHLQYEDKGDIAPHNPLLRISTKFEALSREAQWKLYGYAEVAMENAKRPATLADRFWSLLQEGGREKGVWTDIEKYANKLLTEERPWE